MARPNLLCLRFAEGFASSASGVEFAACLVRPNTLIVRRLQRRDLKAYGEMIHVPRKWPFRGERSRLDKHKESQATALPMSETTGGPDRPAAQS